MGDEVLKTMEKRGLDIGLKSLVEALKEYCPDFPTLYKEVTTTSGYATASVDDVRKYY